MLLFREKEEGKGWKGEENFHLPLRRDAVPSSYVDVFLCGQLGFSYVLFSIIGSRRGEETLEEWSRSSVSEIYKYVN